MLEVTSLVASACKVRSRRRTKVSRCIASTLTFLLASRLGTRPLDAVIVTSFAQANPGFLRAAVVRSDADALLLPLLRTLHNCGSGGGKSAKTSVVASTTVDQPQQQSQQHQQQQQQKIPPAELYVPAIVVLLFSQDSAFNRQAFRQVIYSNPFLSSLRIFFFPFRHILWRNLLCISSSSNQSHEPDQWNGVVTGGSRLIRRTPLSFTAAGVA